MRRVLAMIVVFAVACALAGWLAFAPVAGSASHGLPELLDRMAQIPIAAWGRGNAVLAVLATGLIITIVIALLGTRGHHAAPAPFAIDPDSDDTDIPATIGAKDTLLPPPDETLVIRDDRQQFDEYLPREMSPETFIGMSRPATEPDADTPAQTEHAQMALRDDAPVLDLTVPVSDSLPARPVLLVRKPRDRDRDWSQDTSWLGGLPRLGPAAWPRDEDGTPLPFAAQVDLVDIAGACPEMPLSPQGSLAFFLGAGAVVQVPPGFPDFTMPPPGLPPAFDEGGFPFPQRATVLSRETFPYWPVEAITLDIPESCRDPHDDANDATAEAWMAQYLSEHFGPHPRGTFRAGIEGQAPPRDLWWHGVANLAVRLDMALASAPRQIGLKADRLAQAHAALVAMETRGHASADDLARAQRQIATGSAELERMKGQASAMPHMVEAMHQFVSGRAPWVPLTDEEYALVEDIMAELHDNYGELVHMQVPTDLAQLTTLSLRTMVSGPPEALAAMPSYQLDRINTDHALANLFQHQMFGLGGRQVSARDAHRDDLLLMQLGYDDMMEWRWGDMGLYQFWIAPQAAAEGRWDQAVLTFESA